MDRARLRAALVAAAALVAGALAAAPAAALSVDSMYEPTTVVVIELGLSPEAEAALEAEPDEYVAGTFSIAETDGTPDGIGPATAPVPVGIRLKGNASFQGLDGKASFKVKFNEFGGSKYMGLKRLTLNNMVQDPSMLHEALAYPAFAAAGLLAPRAGYAYVYVNGVDHGLHLNLETLDDVALERMLGEFDDPQHLYEGGPLFELAPESLGMFEVDEGDEDELGDLEALIAAANAAEPSFSQRLAPVADLALMTRFWAAERYLGHWDGYSGPNVNNYFLLSDPGGVFQMLPWGTDQTLRNWWYPFTGNGGTLFDQCLAEPACLDSYKQDLEAVAESTAALDLAQRAQALAAQLAPWQAREIAESERAPFGAATIGVNVEQVLEFLALRPGTLAKWLNTGEGPPDQEAEEETPGTGAPPAATTVPGPALPARGATISTRLDLDRSRLGRGLLVARPTVWAAGTITLRASIGPPGNRRGACLAGPTPVAAGSAYLECRLTDAVRRRLAKRSLALRLTVGHLPPDGPAHDVTRLVRLPRQAF